MAVAQLQPLDGTADDLLRDRADARADGMGHGINFWLAWGYVGFRIVHSIVQCTVNIVAIRFPIFLLASFCLIGLTVHAGARILHDCGIL